MIDIERAKKEFEKYTSNYDPEQPRVKLKINHIGRVIENCKKIAESLKLSEEDIKLAMLLGYFHDIGRFEQVRIADTFSDRESGINHAMMSCKVLFEDGLIKNFLDTDEYNEIIRKAILNHNRYKIEDGLTERELLFAKLIRDADKLDIFYSITVEDMNAIFWYKGFDDIEISEKLMNDYKNHDCLNYADIHTNADQIVTFYAYVYDLYFDISKNILKNSDNLDKFKLRALEYFKSPKIHEQLDVIDSIYHDYIKNS